MFQLIPAQTGAHPDQKSGPIPKSKSDTETTGQIFIGFLIPPFPLFPQRYSQPQAAILSVGRTPAGKTSAPTRMTSVRT